MGLRDDVLDVLNAVCEGSGVSADDEGDISVLLGDDPLWVRVFDEPPTVCVFCQLATEVPLSPDVTEFLHDTCRLFVVFRVLWENEQIILRADLSASPFVPGQLQRIVEDFEKVVAELAPRAREWSRS